MNNPTFHRTNLNLYVEDVAFMQRVYGRGWTEQVRDIVHQELKAIKERMMFREEAMDCYQFGTVDLPDAK